MMNVILSGILGKMGREITALIAQDDELTLVGGFDTERGEAPVAVALHADELPEQFDVVIDFSAPAGALEMVRFCVEKGKPLVTGTTGFTEKELEVIRTEGTRVPLFMASNMSMGINTVLALLEEIPKAVYDTFDVEIVETHHRMKKDSPSGTAKTIASVVSEKSGKESLVHGREGRGLERKVDEIGVHAVRGGTVVGTHAVYLHGNNESIEIIHRASSRKIFAFGALEAAKWIVKQGPGLYSMKDLLAREDGTK
jgi:4-hydroxy-tetrahydrodipicolinate reductase